MMRGGRRDPRGSAVPAPARSRAVGLEPSSSAPPSPAGSRARHAAP